MRFFSRAGRCAFAALLVLLPVSGAMGQSTEQELKARLMGKPLFLRGMWKDDKLSFDSGGGLLGKSKAVPFTLAGVDVQTVHLRDDALELEGQRFVLLFSSDKPVAKPLRKINLTVARPVTGDYGPALDEILTSIDRMGSVVPDYWKPYFAMHFPAPGMQAVEPQKGAEHGSDVITPPINVKTAPFWDSNGIASSFGFRGVSTVSAEIDTGGRPINVRVARPIGFGLDDDCATAVAKYLFKPAMAGDTPVQVRINIECNFR